MSKSVSFNLPQVKSLMHYFGYEYVKMGSGTWEFRHKVFHGHYCYVTQRFGGSFIAKVQFQAEIGSRIYKPDTSNVKTWGGLFTALRSHTKSLIHRREVLNQQKQAA